ncbi:MAG: thiamine phosphate synthase [Verrucomicrobiota bacterium]
MATSLALMKAIHECHLYTFVDTAFLHGRTPVDVARQLCEGGSDIIQLRAKNETADQVRRLAEAILPVTRAAGVPLVINDYPQLAAELGAECCHLGQEDFFDTGYRHKHDLLQALPSPSHFRLGLSTHQPDQALRALQAAPDYIAIGPVYATGTKPAAKPVTLDYVRWAAKQVPIPWFAIGGIQLTNLPEVLAAGARRICVVSAILNADDITVACRRFRASLDATL